MAPRGRSRAHQGVARTTHMSPTAACPAFRLPYSLFSFKADLHLLFMPVCASKTVQRLPPRWWDAAAARRPPRAQVGGREASGLRDQEGTSPASPGSIASTSCTASCVGQGHEVHQHTHGQPGCATTGDPTPTRQQPTADLGGVGSTDKGDAGRAGMASCSKEGQQMTPGRALGWLGGSCSWAQGLQGAAALLRTFSSVLSLALRSPAASDTRASDVPGAP